MIAPDQALRGNCRIFMLFARTAVALLLWLAVTTCAAAQATDGDRQMRRLLARPQRLLFSEELRGNCAGLTVTIKTHIDRLREFQKSARKEREGPTAPLFGEQPAAASLAKERDRVEALNVVLDAKGCTPVNIEEELKRVPPPRPESTGKDATGTKSRFR